VRVVERAKIMLLCAEGQQNREIAELLGTTRRTVGIAPPLCPKRNARHRKDAPRPWRQKPIAREVVEEVVRKTTQDKPVEGTHWSSRSLAQAMGLSASTIRGGIFRTVEELIASISDYLAQQQCQTPSCGRSQPATSWRRPPVLAKP
jgi:IS30 family transposase